MTSEITATGLTWYERNSIGVSNVVIALGISIIMFGIGAGTIGSIIGSNIQEINKHVSQIQSVLMVGGFDGGIIGGLIVLIAGFAIRYDLYNKNKNKPEVVKISREEAAGEKAGKILKGVAVVIGFAILMFGLGMLISGIAVLKSKALDDIKAMIDKGDIKAWVSSTTTKLSLLATAGAITSIAGGGIMVLGGVTGHIKEKWNSWFKKEREKISSEGL